MLQAPLYIREKIPYDLFSDSELAALFPESPARRYGLIKRAIAKGDLIHLRRGLYCLTEKWRRHPLNLFSLAQRIYGPSYISFESALSYHGWIPEAVYTVTSAYSPRSKKFETPLGVFQFTKISGQPFLAGVRQQQDPNGPFFLATPWKALADYIYAYKKDWTTLEPLIHSLRIDEEFFENVDPNLLEEIEESYSSQRVTQFLKGIRKEIAR